MNKFILAVVGFGMLAAITTVWGATPREFRPVLVNQQPEKVFTPYGFDDNDNVEIVLAGNLADTCHKVGPTQAIVDHERKLVLVNPQAYYYSGCWCAQVEVPYVQTLELGIVLSGRYEVRLQQEDGRFETRGELQIQTGRNPGPDDELYAPIQNAVVRWDEGTPYLVLRGTLPTNCMTIKEVRLARQPSDVLVVQPIVRLESVGCRAESRPFEERVNLPSGLQGHILIHVRSLNGQSVNNVVDFGP